MVWHVQREPNVAAQMFVHLLDPAGAMVAQFDSSPVTYGDYPTDLWRAGDVLPFRIAFDVPPSARPGDRFQLRVGLYRLEDGSPRLPATDPAGSPLPDDAATLVDVVVSATEGDDP